MTGKQIDLRLAEAADAEVMHQVITRAFAARPAVDPPAEALSETVQTIRQAIETGYGIIATSADEPVGALLISEEPAPASEAGLVDEKPSRAIKLSRVSVVPEAQQHGVATQMVTAACVFGARMGIDEVHIVARKEFPKVIGWWTDAGFVAIREIEHAYLMSLPLPVVVSVPTADHMRQLGAVLAKVLKPGDVLVASGELGSGKTTLAQGIGQGLNIEGPVISPTFVLSRIHPGRHGGPNLVHVDAYRLGSAAELEDIDLDATLADSVTLIEWGSGLAEGLSESRLEIDIIRSTDPADDTREVFFTGIGPRWKNIDLAFLRSPDFQEVPA